MSGHNKWSTIKHKKGAADAKRGKIFTKLIRELTTAARQGGGDVDGNPRLRSAVAAAKAANMPNDNVKRAIMKGTGELEGETYEENTYEGYGPGGVAFIIDTLTDNRNRTVAEVRHIMNKHGGSMAESGSVAWKFERKGLVVIEKEKEDGAAVDEDELLMAALDAGAVDVKTEEDAFYVYTVSGDLDTIRGTLEEAGFPIERAEHARIASVLITVEGKAAEQVLRLVDALEESDDVQNVWANFDIPDSVLESMSDD